VVRHEREWDFYVETGFTNGTFDDSSVWGEIINVSHACDQGELARPA